MVILQNTTGYERTGGEGEMGDSRTERKRLVWIVNFINQDIDQLRSNDFLKLLIELFETIVEGVPSIVLPKIKSGESFLKDTPDRRIWAKSVQARIKSIFAKIYEAEKGKLWTPVLDFSKRISVLVGQGKVMIATSPNFDTDLEFAIAQLICDCSPGTESTRSLENLKRCRAPIGRGRKKTVCGNFFWQAHKKEKNYCSMKCAWRTHSAERKYKKRS